MGIILSPIAILFQFGFSKIAGVDISSSSSSMTYVFWAAFIEEIVKFYGVVLIAVKSPDFDEPMDAVIYMICAALGFAAIENVLFLFKIIPQGNFFLATSAQNITALETLTLRSVGATVLHALSSAIIGYFLAMSWFFAHHRKKLILIGIIIGALFHFSFNVFLSAEEALTGLGISIGLLGFMGFLVYILFDKVRDRHEQSRLRADLTISLPREYLIK
jgi:RsiW-degrading membrane proteinase PrsW (M82 family)